MKIKTDFLLPALVLFSSNSYAFDWLFEPDFSFKEKYDDNLRLQANPNRTNLISTLSPGLMLGYLAENQELKTNLKWNELIYHGESSLDFSEKLANIGHQYRGELFKTALTAGYSEQSTLSTQLDEFGSGNLRTQVAQSTKSISPSFTYYLSEKNSLQLGYGYMDVKFDKPPGIASNSSLSDYSNQQFSVSATHAYTERLSFNVTGSYSEFESSSNFQGTFIIFPVTTTFSQKSTNLNYQAGLQYAFSEQTQLSLSAGIRNTETQTTQITKLSDSGAIINSSNPPPRTTSGHIFSAALTRKSEWGDINFSAGQQLNPASSGTQQTSTTFSASANYNLSERWSTGINAGYLLAESVSTFDNTNVSNNRTYASVSPNIRWRWTPDINLEFSYSYRQQKFESTDQTAVGNSVQLQFSYQPQINRQVK
ncbi:hypothetical protein [Methylomonas rosea]|uniref:Beta-barrel porin 2 n=1 Tax=Methylomonas rosea TaxID=2952227 RepID=A0ABT1TRP4_9GAMM|nr:hypothetical protein [Methylomonas sp. WSC-7]MCQ8117448.1 hypothetical protein [Methylomonas sp. WSC-7]